MKKNRTQRPVKIFRMSAMTVSLSASLALALAAEAALATGSDQIKIPRSVFTMPANPQDGCDPFFPESTRPYEAAAAANPKVADITSLVLRGFSGSMDHRLVIINNHTFGVGDEGDVVTSAGRLHVSCIEIKTNSVVIAVGGQRHEIFYVNQP
jgi:hypothetical protein